MTAREQHPTTLVIFGATGDLMQQKLAPALLNLFVRNQLPEIFQIVGFSRRDWSHEEFRVYVRDLLPVNLHSEEVINDFLRHVYFFGGNLDDQQAYVRLAKFLHDRDAAKNVCSNKLYYLAVPPLHYKGIFERLSASGLTIPCIPGPTALETVWTRVLVEKPFGNNLEEAQVLDAYLATLFTESQIFRIDHYLGKEAIQNILTFRFKEKALESVWNKDHIERIELRLFEKNSVGKRGASYDPVGALRDVGQNHLLQMLALTTMDEPQELDAASIRKARVQALMSVHLPKHAFFARGRYAGYLNEPGVRPGSTTETYFKIQLGIENVRWQGVPVYIESGKGLSESMVDVRVVFKANRKEQRFVIQDKAGTPDAYERVLFDCIRGDQTIFTTTDEVEAEWRLTSSILASWEKTPLFTYPPGTRPEDIKNYYPS